MYWITAAKSNLDTRKAILLPLNSVFKISDIVKYNFFPTCKNILVPKPTKKTNEIIHVFLQTINNSVGVFFPFIESLKM